jgi:hypothetical protein
MLRFYVNRASFPAKGWQITRFDQGCPNGCRITSPRDKLSRREAVNIARLLAGWRGSVTVSED